MHKRHWLHAGARNLGVIMRALYGIGTPGSWQDRWAQGAALWRHWVRVYGVLWQYYVRIRLPAAIFQRGIAS